MKNLKYITLGVIVFAIASCTKTQFDEFETSSGSANFSNYIAVGNSLTQGFQDNGVHNENAQQDNSYPAIIAQQMKLSSPSLNFIQPTVTGNGSGYKHLEWINEEIEVTDVAEDGSWSSWGNQSIKYNNLGISGIRLTDCVPTDGDLFSSSINQFVCSANPMGRFLDFGTLLTNEVSYLDHIKSSNATFFTNWLGNNDVLGWATSGGDDGNVSTGLPFPFPSSLNVSEMTDPTIFRNKYDSILDAFKKMGAEGVCATIPDVTSIPFFTTITLDLIGDDIWITEGPYSSNPGNVRLATDDDLLTLYAKDNLGDGIGFTQANPIPHGNVLDKDEVAVSQIRTTLLNNEIKASAASHGYPVADMYEYMKELKSGIIFDGVELDARYIEGGAFSLDGIHPNTRGYALVANKFIEVINQAYGSNLRPVIVSNYTGIIFPN
jgi:lysophospholipase L1-like esterase